MKRVMLRVAYDGTNYCGWQKQPNAITVEQRINEAISDLTKEQIEVIGASRTDSGVHSYGNVAVFDTNSQIPAEKFMFALNVRLPEDIRITQSCEVESDFHPRHCDCNKTYEYKIYNAKIALPTARLYTHHEYVPLDLQAMKKGAKYIVGEHDFAAFCSTGSQAKETVRTVYSLTVEKENDIITIRINGNGFLYNMVRIIAGTLINVGKGILTPEDVKKAVESMDRQKAGPTAPARGLTLVKINFKKEYQVQRQI